MIVVGEVLLGVLGLTTTSIVLFARQHDAFSIFYESSGTS